MCTITLTYDQNNALARRKLAALLKTGLFVQTEAAESPTVEADKKMQREEIDAFLLTSKRNMANVIARYL